MNRIRQLHLYLGVFFAPLIIFFAFSGALQTFSLHESPKGSTSQPSAWIVTLAEVHKDQRTVHAAGARSSVALKWFIALMALGLIATSLLGISMAFKFNRDLRVIWGLLALGVILPLALLYRH